MPVVRVQLAWFLGGVFASGAVLSLFSFGMVFVSLDGTREFVRSSAGHSQCWITARLAWRLLDSLQNELLKMEDSLNLVVSTLQDENAMLVEKVTELEGPNNPRVVAAYREINRLRR